jgi:hypothetical protein
MKSGTEEAIDMGGNQSNNVQNEEQIVRIIEIPAPSSTANKTKKKDVSKSAPAEKRSSSPQGVDSELSATSDTSSKKASDD